MMTTYILASAVWSGSSGRRMASICLAAPTVCDVPCNSSRHGAVASTSPLYLPHCPTALVDSRRVRGDARGRAGPLLSRLREHPRGVPLVRSPSEPDGPLHEDRLPLRRCSQPTRADAAGTEDASLTRIEKCHALGGEQRNGEGGPGRSGHRQAVNESPVTRPSS
jgi:hypothetical protein